MPFQPYKTLLSTGEEELIIKKSRFLVKAVPVQSEEAALACLSARRAEHPGASHTCFAYIIGPNKGIMRYSDDGEPGGTAGMPIIETMKARDVTDCVVMVTRYFGGILLGAGGLTRAYAASASQGIDRAGVGTMWPTTRCLIDIPYPTMPRFEYWLEHHPYVRVEDKSFAETVTFTCVTRSADLEKLETDMTELSNGTISPLKMEEEYMAWPEPTV